MKLSETNSTLVLSCANIFLSIEGIHLELAISAPYVTVHATGKCFDRTASPDHFIWPIYTAGVVEVIDGQDLVNGVKDDFDV